MSVDFIPWWTILNPRARYFVTVLDNNTGDPVYSGVAISLAQLTEIIAPTFIRMGYPVPSCGTIQQMRSGKFWRHKNGYSLANVLKIQDLNPPPASALISCTSGVNVTDPSILVQ